MHELQVSKRGRNLARDSRCQWGLHALDHLCNVLVLAVMATSTLLVEWLFLNFAAWGSPGRSQVLCWGGGGGGGGGGAKYGSVDSRVPRSFAMANEWGTLEF